ncbi:MAG TPA: DUF6569 family protein [Bacteroidia bacterium]
MNKNAFIVLTLLVLALGTAYTFKIQSENWTLKKELNLKKSSAKQSYSLLKASDIIKGKFIEELSIYKSFQYENLQIFILKSKTMLNHENFCCLKDALKAKKAIIRETSNVSKLSIDNLSNETIYINSGEIVRGGKQDRTIQNDYIIGPGSFNNVIESYCVEKGRWQQRGDEKSEIFETSENLLGSSELRTANSVNNDQNEVWKSVTDIQNNMSNGLRYYTKTYHDINGSIASSSLELSLNYGALKQVREKIRAELISKGLDFKGSNGIAVAINGEIVSIDLYNNESLFLQLSDKLLNAAIDESISKKNEVEYRTIEQIDIIHSIHAKTDNENYKIVNPLTLVYSSKQKELFVYSSIYNPQQLWLHRTWTRISENKTIKNDALMYRNIEVN